MMILPSKFTSYFYGTLTRLNGAIYRLHAIPYAFLSIAKAGLFVASALLTLPSEERRQLYMHYLRSPM